jgi:hypothetical protein
MKKMAGYILTVLVLTGYLSCKKPFSPRLASVTTNFLAVDGPILSGDSTIITLSRTTSLSDTTQQKAELKAVISVENDQGTLYPLTEKGNGVYTLGVTNFSSARQYRLDIKTTDGKIYQSDFVPMKVTPPIDSIYFNQNSAATVLIYVNSHDPTNSTRYYRWDYKETWSYVPLYQAFYEYKNGQIISVVPNSSDDLRVCYQSDNSNQIFVGSSAKLAQDVIANQQLGGLANGSAKLGHVYVMQLRQYALTQDGFNYYQNIQTNTENLGSIFDAQPSTTIGNIHCITSPTDLVIGFVSASTVTTKQFNLHHNDLQIKAPDPYGDIVWLPAGQYNTAITYSSYYFPPPDTPVCHYGSFKNYDPQTGLLLPVATVNAFISADLGAASGNLMVDEVFPPPWPPPFPPPPWVPAGAIIYYYAPKACVDCRLKGGTNTPPSYFPYPAY